MTCICADPHWNWQSGTCGCIYPYFNRGEYIGSCGEVNLRNVFMALWYYKQKQQFARRLMQTGQGNPTNVSSLQQMVEEGLIEAFTSFVVEVPPREDEDINTEQFVVEFLTPREDPGTEEVDPQQEWPLTDDGF